jgi:hypothetical protein
MKIIQLMNKQREIVGQIHWISPDQHQVEVADPTLQAELNNLITNAREQGLPFRSGSSTEYDKGRVFVENLEQVKSEDERFLPALVNKINSKRFSEQRLFCVLRDVEVGHAGL